MGRGGMAQSTRIEVVRGDLDEDPSEQQGS